MQVYVIQNKHFTYSSKKEDKGTAPQIILDAE